MYGNGIGYGTASTKPGIVPLAVFECFDLLKQFQDREFLLRISYLEIYNEIVNDLLNPTSSTPIKIQETKSGLTMVIFLLIKICYHVLTL